MQRDVCDRCLAVNTGDEEFAKLSIMLTKNQDVRVHSTLSLCPKCEPVVEGIISDRIMLTETPADVKEGSLFGRPIEPREVIESVIGEALSHVFGPGRLSVIGPFTDAQLFGPDDAVNQPNVKENVECDPSDFMVGSDSGQEAVEAMGYEDAAEAMGYDGEVAPESESTGPESNSGDTEFDSEGDPVVIPADIDDEGEVEIID